MAEAVTLDVVIAWFREYQKNCIIKDGVVPEWFHGIISRKKSEERLMTKSPGCFLIRVSESRIGYTLSYRANDCCRHFMIDMLPDNQYVIVGEKMHHRSLDDLVAFHRHTPIAPFTELLVVACDPHHFSKEQVDGAELLFSPSNTCHSETEIWPDIAHTQPNTPDDQPPALPAQSRLSHPSVLAHNPNINFTGEIIPSRPRLYPSLDEELRIMNLHDTEAPPPLPRARSKSVGTSPQILSKPTTGGETRLPKQRSEQKSPTEMKVFSLAQYKKIFQKKKNHPEENMPMTNKKTSAVIAKRDGLINNLKAGLPKSTANPLPTEYCHNPPPFAPGY